MLAHIIVHGIVQGVGFRYTVLQKALAADVTGWVLNRDDGTVEIEVEGSKEQLDQFIASLKKGNNRFIHITNLDIKYSDRTKGYRKFEVKWM